MTELHRALAEIAAIRGQMARAVEFHGYGPATCASTGILAFLAAALQAHVLKNPLHDVSTFLTIWASTAALAVMITGVETITRTRRVHTGMAREMIHSALDHFLPAILAGVLVTVVLMRSAPQTLWMLPGLWQILFSLGVLSSRAFLPRPTFAVGVWYLTTGLYCLAFGGGEHALAPWTMGIPFGIGQLLVAAVLSLGYQERDERA
ncbi:MAG TPA: hypothetical protein VMT29_03175 [Steroidobacteraceae bacterium]|nr:hypothetical protein [Steroidobacteraceae bacterium]